MAPPLDFPSSPSTGTTYTGGNGVVYTWTGTVWLASGASAGGDFCAISPGGTIGASLAVVIPATVITGNSGGWYSNSTGRYSPPAGRYAICGTISGFNAGAVVGPQLQLRKNGTAIVTSATSSTAGNVCEAVVSGTFDANGADFFDLAASSGTAVTYFGSGAVFTAFPISGIKGPPGDPGTALAQNAQTGNYTLVLGDANGHIYHPVGAGAGDTYTIPANASVAYPIGTTLTFVNDDATNAVTIAITTDTMVLSPGTTTGSRTLATGGVATALKVTSTRWIVNGTGLT